MADVLAFGFGVNQEVDSRPVAPTSAGNLFGDVQPGTTSVRSIAGPAVIDMIDVSVESSIAADAAFAAGYYGLFIVKNTQAMLSPLVNSNSAYANLGELKFGRFGVPGQSLPITFPNDVMKCEQGEYLHVVVTNVIDSANLPRITRASLGVYGRSNDDDMMPLFRFR